MRLTGHVSDVWASASGIADSRQCPVFSLEAQFNGRRPGSAETETICTGSALRASDKAAVDRELRMQRLSVTVLLKFLSRYSQWNLVRQEDCYHLYFIAKKEQKDKIFGRRKKRCRKRKKAFTDLTKKQQSLPPVVINSCKTKTVEDENVARPQSVTESESVIATDISRRSSFSSFIWDDYLPSYKQDSDDQDNFDNHSNETLTDGSNESGKSTPVRSKSSREHFKMEKFYEASVLQQGDRLLKEMLQLRKDLEKDKMAFDFSAKESKETNNGLLPDYGPLEQNEENILREKLEMMTLQIKKEMEEEFHKHKSQLEFAKNDDEDLKIKKIFKNILLGKFSVKLNALALSPLIPKYVYYV